MSHQPLKGVRVLDFCWMIAGPLTTRLLADLGAEVLKVESMNRIDRIRDTGVQPPDRMSLNTNGVFHDCNPNKQSVNINLATPEGVALVKELVACSDVVTSNFTPDRMDRWGLGYDHLRAIRPDIIDVNMSVMGMRGPRREWGSYGNGIIAMAGINAHTGFPDRAPVGLGTLHSDFTTPYFGALQIMAALYHRDLTGEGQFIEISQYEAAVHLLDTELVEYLVNGHEPPRTGNRSLVMAPHGVFPCDGADSWVAIAVRDTDEWLQLCAAIQRPDLAARADLHTLEGRRAAEDEIEAAISAWTARHDRWTIAEHLQSLGIPAGPVEDVGDLVADDPSMRGYFKQFDHPEGVTVLSQHEPITWNGDRLPLRLAPLLGEHNADVITGLLGHDEDTFARLLVENVLY